MRRTAIEEMLNPRSVAVLGASEDPNTFNGAPIHNLRAFGFSGEIYPVNPKRDEVQGIKCYQAVAEIPGAVETAIIVVPARYALTALQECVDHGIRSVTIVSSGFSEAAAGDAGQARARELAELVESSGIRLLGPNTIGMLNLLDSYVPRAAHNFHDRADLTIGRVALVSQSGACGNIVFNRAQSNGVGVSLSVATGDQTDVDVWDICATFLDDERIGVVMAIVETFGDTEKFETVAERAHVLKKPIVLLKVGQSALGGATVRTHTGALAGNARVHQAVLRQLGVISVADFDELWEVAAITEAWGPPAGRQRSLGVACFSGGEAGLIADHCAEHDVPLDPPSEEFNAFVAENFEYAMGANPFDLTGEVIGRPEKVRMALKAFVEYNDYDAILLASPLLRAGLTQRYYQDLDETLRELDAKVLLSAWPAGGLTDTQLSILHGTGAPVLPGSTQAIRALARYRQLAARTATRPVRQPTAPHPGLVSELDADAGYFTVRRTFADLGLTFGEAVLVHDESPAVEAAAAIGFPVVMKCDVPSSVHKTDEGLVRLGLATTDAVRSAFADLSAAGRRIGATGVVIEQTAAGSVHLLLGAHRDVEFGEVIAVGSGGVLAEQVDDVALGLTRYVRDEDAATEMIGRTASGGYLLTRAPETARLLGTWLVTLGRWFEANPHIASVDINPCIADTATGTLTAVDARVATTNDAADSGGRRV